MTLFERFSLWVHEKEDLREDLSLYKDICQALKAKLRIAQQKILILEFEKKLSPTQYVQKQIETNEYMYFTVLQEICTTCPQDEKNVEIFLYRADDKTIKCTRYFLDAINYGSRIHIKEIQCEAGRGFGSWLLVSLIEYATVNGIKRITGTLALCDLETHIERLYRFYTKHGFTIKDIPNENYKRVERNL